MGSLRYPKCENELHFFAVLIFIVFLVKSELKEGICFFLSVKRAAADFDLLTPDRILAHVSIVQHEDGSVVLVRAANQHRI